MATWTDTTVLTARLGAILSGANGTLPSGWSTQVSEALDRAERWMRRTLIGKCGYTAAQITLANWPAGTSYQLDLATFFFLRAYYANHARADIPWETIRLYDVRAELEASDDVNLIDANGAEIVPTETADEGTTGGDQDDGYVPSDLMDSDEYVEDAVEDDD